MRGRSKITCGFFFFLFPICVHLRRCFLCPSGPLRAGCANYDDGEGPPGAQNPSFQSCFASANNPDHLLPYPGNERAVIYKLQRPAAFPAGLACRRLSISLCSRKRAFIFAFRQRVSYAKCSHQRKVFVGNALCASEIS